MCKGCYWERLYARDVLPQNHLQGMLSEVAVSPNSHPSDEEIFQNATVIRDFARVSRMMLSKKDRIFMHALRRGGLPLPRRYSVPPADVSNGSKILRTKLAVKFHLERSNL